MEYLGTKQIVGAIAVALIGYIVGSVQPLPLLQPQLRSTEQHKLKAYLAPGTHGSESIDYQKLARVCLMTVQKGHAQAAESPALGSRGGEPKRTVHNAPNVPPSFLQQGANGMQPDAIIRRKDALDRIMSLSVADGEWSAQASRAALRALRGLPDDEVADFEALLLETLEDGELALGPGAWVPEKVHGAEQ